MARMCQELAALVILLGRLIVASQTSQADLLFGSHHLARRGICGSKTLPPCDERTFDGEVYVSGPASGGPDSVAQSVGDEDADDELSGDELEDYASSMDGNPLNDVPLGQTFQAAVATSKPPRRSGFIFVDDHGCSDNLRRDALEAKRMMHFLADAGKSAVAGHHQPWAYFFNGNSSDAIGVERAFKKASDIATGAGPLIQMTCQDPYERCKEWVVADYKRDDLVRPGVIDHVITFCPRFETLPKDRVPCRKEAPDPQASGGVPGPFLPSPGEVLLHIFMHVYDARIQDWAYGDAQCHDLINRKGSSPRRQALRAPSPFRNADSYVRFASWAWYIGLGIHISSLYPAWNGQRCLEFFDPPVNVEPWEGIDSGVLASDSGPDTSSGVE
ncbi:MAG: hypothetical protein M1825_003229 [Sarcosagium campestre]|nr:MAG: hypothetical protein M1825_003229 [Sarcosagium campestre]